MTVGVLVYATVVAVPLAAAALVLERGASRLRLPRRWFWMAALGATLALPLCLPWRAPADPSGPMVASTTGLLAAATTGVGRWWTARLVSSAAGTSSFVDQLALTAWAVSSLSLLAVYLLGVASLIRRRSRWPAAAIGRYRILVSDDVGPAVAGFWSPNIVVPQWALSLEPSQLALLLRHERAHQTARDSVLVHFSELAVTAMPWNPAAWWMRARLRAAIELDCDARVLESDAGTVPSAEELSTYGHLLLTVAARPRSRSGRLIPALIERPSVLERRILAMQPTPRRHQRSRFVTAGLVAAVLVMAAIIVPAPALRAQQGGGAYRPGSPGLKNPVVLKSVRPTYTPEAMRAKVEGSVAVEGVVTSDGRFEKGAIAKSLDTVYGLDEQALKAARKWTFRPGTLDGKAVPVVVTIEMSFRLH